MPSQTEAIVFLAETGIRQTRELFVSPSLCLCSSAAESAFLDGARAGTSAPALGYTAFRTTRSHMADSEQLGLMFAAPQRKVYAVRELMAALRTQVERSFTDIYVEGEISNYRPAESGHLYFTLKDGASQLRVVMWRSQAQTAALPSGERTCRHRARPHYHLRRARRPANAG